MEAAFESGAQLVSTDYYRPDERHLTDSIWTDYSVFLPNRAIARTSPVLTTASYKGDLTE